MGHIYIQHSQVSSGAEVHDKVHLTLPFEEFEWGHLETGTGRI